MTFPGLVETEDSWLLPLAGLEVLQVCVAHQVDLMFDDSVVQIEQPFVVVDGDGHETAIVPGADPDRVAPALRLWRRQVTEARAYKDGRLRMRFADRSEVRVAVGDGYEAWSFSGKDGLLVVSLPDGELGIWTNKRSDGS